MKEAQVEISGGRRLSYADLGDPNGRCVFFFHGAPSSRLQLASLDEQLAGRGLRVVSPDRPGYGGSSPQPGRSLLDWPTDAVALADALAIERFAVAGHSSGGAYAVACAAQLPERVTAAWVLAGVTDMGWPGAWQGFVETEAMLMRMGDADRIHAWCAEHFGADGSAFMTASAMEPSPPDAAWLADERQAAALGATFAEAFRQGVIGYAHDVFVQSRPWRFDPRSVSVPVEIVHGEPDTLVPIGHSHHTAARIPGARLRALPGHGHLTILSELPDLLLDV